MKRNPNKKTVGLFIVIGLAVFLGIIAMYVMARVEAKADEKEQFVMYFDESIKGLNVGSSVMFQGVEIGKVSRINLRINPDTLAISIPVYATLNPEQRMGKSVDTKRKDEVLKTLIKKGLRAHLVTQSFITGALMIELEILPMSGEPKYKSVAEGDVEIPTVLSSIGQLSQGLQDLPIREMVDNANRVLSKMDKFIDGNSVKAGDVIGNANKTLVSIDNMARSMRQLADFLERHPEAIIRGK